MTQDAADDTSFGGWRACDVCGEPIATIEEAALAVREALVEERRAVRAAEEQTGTVNPDGFVQWDWGHRECLDPLVPLHVVPGPRLNTLPRLMARTLELIDEDWFAETAWEDAVRRFYRIPFD